MSTTTTTIERPDDARDTWLPIFSAGYHLGRDWTRGDVARIVANYDLLRTPDGGGVLPPVRIGHADPNLTDAAALAEDQLAHGHIAGLKLSEDGTRVLARLSQVSPQVRRLTRAGRLFRISAEIIPRIELSTIARNLGARASAARGPAIVGAGLLGTTRPEAVDLPALTPAAFAQDDRENEETGIQTLHFSAAELRGDQSPPLSAGAQSVLHHVGRVRHHANELGDLLGVRSAAADDDATPTTTALSLGERLAEADKKLNFMARTRRAGEVLMETYDQPKIFGSFDAQANPDDVGSLGQTFCDSVDSELARQNLPHDDVAARRRVAEAVLRTWKEQANPFGPGTMADGLSTSDFARAVEGFARNKQSYAEGALPSVDANGDPAAQFRTALEQQMARRGWPIEDTQKRRECARIILSEWGTLPADPKFAIYSEVVMNYSPSTGEPAFRQKERGVTQASERGFAQISESKREEKGVPLYGSAAMRASELGSEAAYRRLLVLASENGLRLGRTEDRKRAEALLCKEMGNAGDVVTFGERGGAGEPPMYGSRGRPAPTPGAREIAFTENVAARLRTMDLLDPHRVAKAYRAEAALHPQLTPDYGWSTRARRARG